MMLTNLKKIKNATLLLSNPTIEFWFLLHYKSQKASISSSHCTKALAKSTSMNYQKGYINEILQKVLDKNYTIAAERAKELTLFENPSSNIYVLINELIKAKTINE
ncbi:MAG: hypothetical protein EOM83_08625 [Clostridia bacterium]|nr:hypothetical protein [Clostridia bacterium]